MGGGSCQAVGDGKYKGPGVPGSSRDRKGPSVIKHGKLGELGDEIREVAGKAPVLLTGQSKDLGV